MTNLPNLIERLEAASGTDDKCCGTCRLYSNNLFADQPFMDRNRCCADVSRDMPSSWKNDNYMNHRNGKDCPIWEEAALRAREADRD